MPAALGRFDIQLHGAFTAGCQFYILGAAGAFTRPIGCARAGCDQQAQAPLFSMLIGQRDLYTQHVTGVHAANGQQAHGHTMQIGMGLIQRGQGCTTQHEAQGIAQIDLFIDGCQ